MRGRVIAPLHPLQHDIDQRPVSGGMSMSGVTVNGRCKTSLTDEVSQRLTRRRPLQQVDKAARVRRAERLLRVRKEPRPPPPDDVRQ